MWLEQRKWTELDELGDRVFMVPLGSFEQHGPHLPLITDSAIITEVARRVEAARPDGVVVAPTLWIGHSPHHQRFGCVSLDLKPYMEMLAGVCRSLVRMGARRLLLLNGHGGNDIPAKAAMRELKSEFSGRKDLFILYATYWSVAARRLREIRTSPAGGMGHACEMETSVMLALRPGDVDMRAAVDCPVRDPGGRRIMDMLESAPYHAVFEFDELSPTGTVGLPSHASAEKGERFLAAIAEEAVRFVDEFAAWPHP